MDQHIVKNIRVTPHSSDKSKTVAFASCNIETAIGMIYLNNMTLVDGTKGLFLSFPSRKLPKPDAKGNEYQSHYFMDHALKEVLQPMFLKEYEVRLKVAQLG